MLDALFFAVTEVQERVTHCMVGYMPLLRRWLALFIHLFVSLRIIFEK